MEKNPLSRIPARVLVRRISLPSLGATLSSVLFAPVGRPAPTHLRCFLRGARTALRDKERLSPPRFTGDPCADALLSDPGEVWTSGRYNAETVAFR